MISEIPLLLDTDLLQAGIRRYINMDFNTTPHCLISGETGSGKSYLFILLMGKISKYFPHAKIYCLDFKRNDELRCLLDVPNARYFTYLNVVDGLHLINSEFESRLQGSTDRTPIFVFFDEHNSFISYLTVRDKKLAEEQKMILGNIAFMGRSLGLKLILSMQRCDSISFSNGARDQFGLRIGLGALSPEAKKMLFGEYDTDIIMPCSTGYGWMADSRGLRAIRVPRITRMDKLCEAITDAVTR